MKKKGPQENSFTEILLYNTPNGGVKVEIYLQNETVWLTQQKIADLFDVDRTVITKHLKNIFETNELDPNSVSAKIAHTATALAMLRLYGNQIIFHYHPPLQIPKKFRIFEQRMRC